MKRILFIIPSLSIGGTNSSLDSFYPFLRDRYEIGVFAISHHVHSRNYSFEEALLPKDVLLSLIYSNYSELKGSFRIAATFIKACKAFFRVFGKDLGLVRGKQVARIIEKGLRYDWVVGFQEGDATKIASLFSIQKLAWIHCNYRKYLPQGSEEIIYKRFNRVVCVSAYTASVFTDCYPSLSKNVVAIHNIIDTKRILSLANEVIDDNSISERDVTLISVGRFSKVKRFREIPYIASVLKRHGIKFMWYVIGPNDLSDECRLFQFNIEELMVHDCVRWLGGKSNPYPFFKLANLYVCLSESEACPMVFKEAKLFGLPIVSTDFPSSYEFLQDGEGIITSIEDLPKAIEEMICKLENGYRLDIEEEDGHKDLEKVYALFD